MKIKSVSYENFNGLTNSFEFGNGLNAIVGSNGTGKTTTLDSLGVLLFGESFSYNKTLEKHINIVDKTQKAECKMVIQTDDMYIDENDEEKKVEQEFSIRLEIKSDGKFTQTCFVNGTKCSRKAYDEKLSSVFNIDSNLLSVEKINVMRALIDPNCISEGDNAGFYNLIKVLTNVMTIQEFANSNNEFANIRGIIMGVDTIQEAEKAAKDSIDNVDKEIAKVDELIKSKENETNELNFNAEEYNSSVDKFESKKKEYGQLQEDLKALELKLTESNAKDSSELSNKKLDASKKINDLLSKKNDIQKNINSKYYDITNLSNKKNNILRDISTHESLLEQQKNSKFETFVCVHCGKIANENDLERFNNGKNGNIEKIQNYIEECKNNLANVDNQLQNLMNEKKALTDKLNENEAQINEANRNFTLLNGTQVEKSKKTIDIENKINEAKESISAVENELNELLNYLNEVSNIINTKNKISAVIEQYEKDKKTYLSNKANAELKQTQIKNFKIAYAKEIESKVGSVFGDIEINMVKEGKNSKEKISCFAVKEGKPIFNYNTAPQKAIGVKIIQCIKNKLGIKGLPIMFDILDNIGEKALKEIVDNADGQVFCTSASYNDNVKLHVSNKVEKENK